MVDFSILIVDDEERIRSGLKDLLGIHNFEVDTAKDGVNALKLFGEHKYSLVLSDIRMPSMDGLELTKQIKALNPETYVVLFTGYSSIDTAVEAIKSGAEEYLLKPLDADAFRRIVARIYNHVALITNNDILGSEILRRNKFQFIGKSSGIQEVKQDIRLVASGVNPVLITGETGTGKELVARSIHDQGPRKEHPFVAINCASIPSDLLESELFGHERGSFPGAVTRKFGLFEVANKGTILLDEIGEMSMESQLKILRALESKQFRRLGAQQETSSDFRVISTTNRNLLKLIEEGKFIEKLYYRLSPFTINVPALRKRKSDIPLLIDYFSARKGRQNPNNDKDTEFINALQSYNWPGNIRELQNTMERVFLLAGDQPPGIDHLPPEIQNIKSQPDGKSMKVSDIPTLAQIQRDYIQKIYRELGGNKIKVAQALGISVRSLYNKLEKRETAAP